MLKKTPEAKEDVTSFLSRVFLFFGVDFDRLARLAGELEIVHVVEGERIYSEGEPGDYFYIIREGKVRLSTGKGRLKRDWDTPNVGGYFGEDLVLGPYRKENAYTLTSGTLLRLEKARFQALLKEFPNINTMVTATAESRSLARSADMKWLGEDEAIYMIARKHEFFLLVNLIIPILIGVFTVPLLTVSFISTNSFLSSWFVRGGGLLLLLFSALLGIWLWADWSNDYYIVTSQRVLWIEKIILLYDSRQEAPLTAVLAKDIAFNQTLHYFIDYGDLTIRTYVGRISMRRAHRPELLVTYINGLQARARELAKRAEAQKMEQLIRDRLNLPVRGKPAATPGTEKPTPPVVQTRKSPIEKIFTNFLKLRYEEGNNITYRKHWLLLLRKLWIPLLLLFGILVAGGAQAILLPGNPLSTPQALIFLWTPLTFIVFGWMLYNYIDWRNDRYILTLDSIIDIERKPLGHEVRKTAPIPNFLSLDYNREGILNQIFNVGDVQVNVGTDKFIFYGMYNPAQVQQEIFERMIAHRARTEEENARKERERLADMFASYHQQVEKEEKTENESDWDIFPG